MKKENRKTIKYVLGALAAVLFLLNILGYLASRTDVREGLGMFPCAFLTVESGSMEPKLRIYDLIMVKEVPYEELQPGDIITYIDGSGLVTHELVRKEADYFVTRGYANREHDEVMVKSAYVAKYAFRIPYGAFISDLFHYTETRIIWVLLVLMIFFGMPAITYIEDRIRGEKPAVRRPGFSRVTGCLAFLSVLLITPSVTEAKYTAKINDITQNVAAASYFTANFLSQGEGNQYIIQGWNPGKSKTIDMQIRNYDNEILFDSVGNNEVYKLVIVKIRDDATDFVNLDNYNVILAETGDALPEEQAKVYSFPEIKAPAVPDWLKADDASNANEITDPEEASDPTEPASPEIPEYTGDKLTQDKYSRLEPKSGYGPFIIAGDVKKRYQTRSILVQCAEGKVIPSGKKVHFQVYAVTASSQRYQYSLLGDFVLHAVQGEKFVESFMLGTSETSLLVTCNLKTTQVGGEATKNVTIEWDQNRVSIDEDEPTVFNMMQRNPELKPNDTGKLTIPLQAYSSVDLQFFKKDFGVDIKNNTEDCAIWYTVFEEEKEPESSETP